MTDLDHTDMVHVKSADHEQRMDVTSFQVRSLLNTFMFISEIRIPSKFEWSLFDQPSSYSRSSFNFDVLGHDEDANGPALNA